MSKPEGWDEHLHHLEVDGIRWAPKNCQICAGIRIHHVTLACGHEWDESCPANFDPALNPRRACGHPDHYPEQFEATYSPLAEVAP